MKKNLRLNIGLIKEGKHWTGSFQFGTYMLFLVLGVHFLQGQATENPFDLKPRLKQTSEKPSSDTVPKSSVSPFDIISTAPNETENRKVEAPTVTTTVFQAASKEYNRWLFLLTVFMIIYLTILIMLFRIYFRRTYQAFLNDNLLSQFHREREASGGLPYMVLYTLFFINGGIFIFLLLHYYKTLGQMPILQLLVTCILGLTILFLFKHILLHLLGWVFPIRKEVRLYSFTIMIFSIILGIFLFPINTLIAYGPSDMTQFVIYFAFFSMIIIYLFRSLRGVFIANKFILFHKFHFLLYICTVEIAPVLVIVKLTLMLLG